MVHLILASQSPRRQDLLRQMGLSRFTLLPVSCDETADPALPPAERVAAISRRKSAAAALLAADREALILTADTMVFLGDAALGKPRDRTQARSMLRALSGREHRVITALTLRRGDRAATETETTAVRFLPLTDRVIEAYLDTGEPMDKAGAYGIQGRGVLLVEAIRGDYSNVVGLPLPRLGRMLAAFGLDPWSKE